MSARITDAFDELSTSTHDIEFDAELAVLLDNVWLQRKLDRTRRLKEHCDYIVNMCPELETMAPGVVLDLGPGDGMFLEYARELEHETFGIDAATGKGGMGDDYLRACQIITGQKCLLVEYVGVFNVIDNWRLQEQQVNEAKYAKVLDEGEGVALINARGSLEQIFSDYMEGAPHHLHHKAADMEWRLNDGLTRKAIREFMRWIAHQLRPGGVFVCHLNGSRNTEEAELCLDKAATAAGLAWGFRTTGRLRVWEKRLDHAEEMASLEMTVCP